ncbi:hypothetical protein BBJ28_00021147 [Nothophytophthora sp. Chile5]|nr:hypothetical protein BBJ28_00021147 [Nothophytophthora sp. Chile5]
MEPMPEDLAHEVAAVAAFLADVTGFPDEEDDAPSPSDAARDDAASVESWGTPPPAVSTASTESQDDLEAAERKRALRNAQTGKRRDAYRLRLKAEWQSLRCQEVELAAQLTAMQHARQDPNDGGDMARAAWRAIAMRQLEGRRTAEQQQRRLKLAVTSRGNLIKDVESMLRKRLREVEANGGGSSPCSSKRPRAEPSDTRLFEAYLEELDPIFAQTDEVFRTCETEPTSGAFLSSKPPKKRDGDTEYFENLGVLVVPFGFQRTCGALWELTHQPYRQHDREQYSGVHDPENTLAVRFRVKCRLQTGGDVSILTHFVSRRYIEAERTVFIWRELWEGEGDLEGMHSDETGWCILEPLESAVAAPHTSTEGPTTLIQTCVRLVPMHFSTSATSDPDVEQFTEVLVTSGKEDNMQVEQMMERLQLGDALAAASLESS